MTVRALAIILLAGAVQAPAQDLPPVHAPRLDDVGMAGRVAGADRDRGIFVAHRTLAPGSFAELTALDSGRTIVAEVRGATAMPPDRVAELSPGAAAALGLSDAVLAPVRVRPIQPSPQDQAALRGGTAVVRLDTPPALLVALRRRLPVTARPAREMTRDGVTPPAIRPPAAPPTRTPAPTPPVAKPAVPASGRWFVQVAALSDASRAAALAKSVDGVVRRAGTLYRVRTGPFATRAAADTARAAIARRGLGDARTIAQD